MKLKWTDKSMRILGILLVALIAGIWTVRTIRTFHDEEKVKQMTTTMKTVCVGRFLVDVPAEAIVTYRGAFLDGWNIDVDVDESDDEFMQRLSKKELELKSAKNEKGGVSLESVRSIKTDRVHGKIFVSGRTWAWRLIDGNKVEDTRAAAHAYVRVSGTSVNFTADFGGDRVEELMQVATQLKALSEEEMPVNPGFCFGRAMISDPLAASQSERVTMFLSLKNHPDFVIALDSAAGLKQDRTLLARSQTDISELYAPLFHTFRRGNREIAGIPGQELCEKIRELNFTAGHNFMWESFTESNNVFQPTLVLEFSTGHAPRPGGKPVGSSLSDDAVLALWDKISSSIRIRPTTTVQDPKASQTMVSR